MHHVSVWHTACIHSQDDVFYAYDRGMRDYQFSFWDAQLWAVARLNQVPVVFGEDFSPGAVVGGVRFVDPFVEDFEPEAWGL